MGHPPETTNRITTTGYTYDVSGNMTNDSIHAYTYDAENRITSMDSAGTYLYDGSGLRIKKGTTTYIYSGTKVIAEYTSSGLQKEYVYSGSQLLATLSPSGTPTYAHPDHLSTRVETSSSGTVTRTYGHYPFGDTWYETGSNKLAFTSYERDSDSGLDYAVMRYNSPRLGRFATADLLAGSTVNPQTLNRYSYVANDPINRIDPMGLLTVCVGDVHGSVETGYWFVGACWDAFDPTQRGDDRPLGTRGGVARAKKILHDNPKCRELFGAVNAEQLLQTYDDNGLIQVDNTYPQAGKSKRSSFETNNIGAVTSRNAGSIQLGPDLRQVADVITVNKNGPYFSGLDKDMKRVSDQREFRGLGLEDIQAAMLLHELAHVARVIPDDGKRDDHGQSQTNSQTIYDHCFKEDNKKKK